jgi:CheY-like chemotaxis protein
MESAPLILIAEDDYEDRFILSETFNELGHTDVLVFVDDGIRLLEYLGTAHPGKVKLIVLDLNMPKLNGTEILRMLKNEPRYAAIPVIIFSTSVNEIEKNICMELGAKEYVTKPVKYAEYISTCERFYSLSKSVD